MNDLNRAIIKDLIAEVDHLKDRLDIASERIEDLEKRWKLARIEHIPIPNATQWSFDGLQV